jgi:hypothetical protein
MPTIGFNMETVVYKNLQFNVWDLSDKDRLALTRKELLSMLEEEELKNTILLVFANKMACHTPRDSTAHVEMRSNSSLSLSCRSVNDGAAAASC